MHISWLVWIKLSVKHLSAGSPLTEMLNPKNCFKVMSIPLHLPMNASEADTCSESGQWSAGEVWGEVMGKVCSLLRKRHGRRWCLLVLCGCLTGGKVCRDCDSLPMIRRLRQLVEREQKQSQESLLSIFCYIKQQISLLAEAILRCNSVT